MIADVCNEASFILRIVVKLVKYMHIIIPIILIVMISFDLFKVFVGQADEKAKKEASNKAAKRLIYAMIVFFVPTIINFVFKKIDSATSNQTNAISTTSTSWIHCWNVEYNK